MQTARQAFALLIQRPVLWVPQLVAAVINLLLNTCSSLLAHHLSERIGFHSGALLTTGLTLYTPDLLVASETVQLPVVLPSKFVQYTLVVAAVAIVADLVRSPQLSLRDAVRHTVRTRKLAILNCGLLLIGLVLFDQMCEYAFAAGFSYIPALRPDPAWLLIMLFWLTDLIAYGLFFAIAVPWILTVVLPSPVQNPDAECKHIARLWMFGAWIAWRIFDYLWGRVEALSLPPRIDPGPFWHAPVTLGHPAFLFLLLSYLSVLAALVAHPCADRYAEHPAV